jgi:V/A-type H+-transporting ATPase subunit E
LVAEAKAEAEAIVKAAEAKAEDLRKNSMAEISLAGKQAVAKIKEQVAEMIIAKSTVEGVKAANLDAEFVKNMLVEVAHNWNGASSENVSLEALLPEAKKAELDAAMEKSAKELLAAGVEVGYSKSVKSGFKVGAKNGGYYISFSDEDFNALLGEYLRDKVAALIFGK